MGGGEKEEKKLEGSKETFQIAKRRGKEKEEKNVEGSKETFQITKRGGKKKKKRKTLTDQKKHFK